MAIGRAARRMHKILDGHAADKLQGQAGLHALLAGMESRPPDAGFKRAARSRILESLPAAGEAGCGLRAGSPERRETKHLLRVPSTKTVAKRAVLVPALVLSLLLVMTTGAYALSLDSDPGSPLYGTKLFFERARMGITGSDNARAELALSFAERRMEELAHMADSGSGEGSQRWISEYRRNLAEAEMYMSRLNGEARLSLGTDIVLEATSQLDTLSAMTQVVPSDFVPLVEEARSTCSETLDSLFRMDDLVEELMQMVQETPDPSGTAPEVPRGGSEQTPVPAPVPPPYPGGVENGVNAPDTGYPSVPPVEPGTGDGSSDREQYMEWWKQYHEPALEPANSEALQPPSNPGAGR
ncbi:MAG: DUF5667 domain-containing protein [Candidatus Geothermincolia bacterium]